MIVTRGRPRMRPSMSCKVKPTLVLPMVLMVLALLLGACDAPGASVTAMAPLPPSMAISYVASSGGGSTSAGVTALHGRDGTNVWHAATGDPSSHWAPI